MLGSYWTIIRLSIVQSRFGYVGHPITRLNFNRTFTLCERDRRRNGRILAAIGIDAGSKVQHHVQQRKPNEPVTRPAAASGLLTQYHIQLYGRIDPGFVAGVSWGELVASRRLFGSRSCLRGFAPLRRAFA